MKIISGGQTGVDRAALDAADALGLACGGWCPKDRRAEDGRIDQKYPLKETEAAEYGVRTEWNVRDSDATLIITYGEPTGGTAYTIAMCRVHKKPHLVIDCHCEPACGGRSNPVDKISSWLAQNKFQVLNIAGPRESNFPGIYKIVKELLIETLG